MEEGKMVRSTFIYVMSAITLFIVGFGPGSGINGKWETTLQGPQGSFQMVFDFQVKADSLTGSVQGPMGGAIPISNGKLNGKKFSFDVSFNGNTIHHECTVEGDSIAMQISGFQGNKMDLTLKRMNQKSKKEEKNPFKE